MFVCVKKIHFYPRNPRQKNKEAITIEVNYKEILEKWGIKLKSVRSDMKVYGSPNRFLKAFVVQNTKGKLYILEKINFFEQIHREKLSKLLWKLQQKGLDKIYPYIPNTEGNFVSEVKLRSWQIREYVGGEKTDRRNYYEDEWRGIEAAKFLIDLYKKGKEISSGEEYEINSISYYAEELHNKIKGKFDADKIYDYIVENYMPIEEKIGLSICHGDFHPLNIIWGHDTINGVIDWEFAGKREMPIDVANMIGCIGSEDPELIFSGMSESFLKTLFIEECFGKKADILIEMIIALRYAGWLSLWLRADDKPMIPREIEYIEYLIENRERYKEYFLRMRDVE